MTQSEHYNLNLVEGTDLVNPLIQDVPNYEAIDAQMFKNSKATVGDATELVSGTVHALTRLNPAADMFRFTATSNFIAGETFTVDGQQVTALLTSGETLVTGAYIIGSEVLCCLRDTLLTMFISGGIVVKADDSDKLDGHTSDYYATASGLESAESTANAAGILAQSCQTQINNINNIVGNLGAISIGGIYDGNVQPSSRVDETKITLNPGIYLIIPNGYLISGGAEKSLANLSIVTENGTSILTYCSNPIMYVVTTETNFYIKNSSSSIITAYQLEIRALRIK